MTRFVFGFVFGAAVGASIIILVTPHSGEELMTIMQEQFNTAQERLNAAIEAGQKQAESHEKELWQDFRERINKDEE